MYFLPLNIPLSDPLPNPTNYPFQLHFNAAAVFPPGGGMYIHLL